MEPARTVPTVEEMQALLPKLMANIPEFGRVAMESLQAAQTLKNFTDGVYFIEFQKVFDEKLAPFKANPDYKGLNASLIDPTFTCGFKMGLFFANNDFTKFSLVPLEGYRKFEDVMKHYFPGCTISD